MKANRFFIGVFAFALFVFLQSSPAFAASQSGTSTYITGYSYVYPASTDGNISSALTVYKSTGLRSGYSTSNIDKAGSTPLYKTSSSPAYGVIGWNFSSNWSISHSETSGDTWVPYLGGDEVYDVSLNGLISQNFYWTFTTLITGRSATVSVTSAIIYSGVSDSVSHSYVVNS